MVSPPIYTGEFLLTCLQYEYHKNKTNPDQAYANMCQMNTSKWIRDEVEKDYTPLGSRSNSSDSTGEGPPDSVNTSKRSRSGSSDSSKDVGGKRRRVGEYDEQMEEVEDPDSDEELNKEPFYSLNKKSLCGENEDDIDIRSVSFPTITSFFEKFKNKIPTTEEEIDYDEMPVTITRIRGYCYNRPGGDGLKHSYNEIKSTIDFHKVKLHLKISRTKNSETSEAKNSETSEAKNSETSEAKNSETSEAKNSETSEAKNSETSEAKNSETSEDKNSETSETNTNFHAEHWDDVNEGCWMWTDDDVRFIEGPNYESLAANYFLSYMKYSDMPLESLEFDIEERTKWSPIQDHSAEFWYKIKKCCTDSCSYGTKKLSMKVFKCRDRTDCPYRLRLLNVGKVEEIKLRVWDDSYLRKDPSRIGYLNNFAQWDQWKSATILDIEDPNLSLINPDISNFEQVKRQFISWTDVMNMREFFERNETWKKCVVTSKEPLRLDRTITTHAGTDDGSKQFRITIEEFQVTYEMIGSNTPESQDL